MSAATLRVNRLHHPVTALGCGTRAGIWVQGCSLGCHGCASRDTWDTEAGVDLEVEALLAWLDGLPEPLDGLTVTGGEPFDQPAALAALLSAVSAWRDTRERPFDLLVFSGHHHQRLRSGDATRAALAHCDTVVSGPYVERRNTGTALRGSDNQRIVPATPLGRERYGDVDADSEARLQVAVEADRVFLIGIPRRDDLERLRSGLTAAGIELGEVTWRP